MTHQPSVGLFTPGWPGKNTPNGIATSVYSLAIGLFDIGAPPVIFSVTQDGPIPPDIPAFDIRQQRYRLQDRIRAKFGDADALEHQHFARRIAATVNSVMAEHPLDALIMEESNGWAGLVQKLVTIPVIVTLHGPWILHKSLQSNQSQYGDRQRIMREDQTFTKAHGLISPSQNVLTAVENATDVSGVPRIVLPNALPISAFDASNSALNILFIGRFDLHKGGDTVLAAVTQLVMTHPTASITFVGPDVGVQQGDGARIHIEDALENLPKAARDCITYLGPVDREGVKALRQTHAIALIASRYENLNYTLLEAMAAGQAIVCTHVGGPAEVLEDEETALLVPADAPEDMAHALGRLLDDAALAQRLGQAAQTKLEQEFNPAKIAAETLDFVGTVIKANGNR